MNIKPHSAPVQDIYIEQLGPGEVFLLKSDVELKIPDRIYVVLHRKLAQTDGALLLHPSNDYPVVVDRPEDGTPVVPVRLCDITYETQHEQ